MGNYKNESSLTLVRSDMVQLLSILAVCFGMSQGMYLTEGLHDHVSTRIIRSINDGTDTVFLRREGSMLLECDINAHDDKKNALRESIEKMNECFKTKKMLEVSKEEYLQHIEQCTRDTRTKWKLCLTESQKYYPDFLLEYDADLITFRYEAHALNQNYTVARELHHCFQRIHAPESLQRRDECVESARQDDSLIPIKQEMCRYLNELGKCYREYMKPCEQDYKAIIKFRDSFLKFTWKPCKS